MMPSSSDETSESSTNSESKSESPTLWIECLPFEVQVRIAHYVSDGKSGLHALNLAKASSLQREVVCDALDHTLKGCFATHANGLVSDWVNVCDDVCVLQLCEHPPNFSLLSAPSLRVLIIEDEPLQLEALAKSGVWLNRLELTIRYCTPSYLVCRYLAEVFFKTFVLDDGKEYMFQHCTTSELVAACQGVETVILESYSWVTAGVADFLIALPSLREVDIDIQGMGSLSEMRPMLEKVQRLRVTAWDSQLSELIELKKETHTSLKELYLMSFEGWSQENIFALREALSDAPELGKLSVPLQYGVERSFPRMPCLTKLTIRWKGELEMLDEKVRHYKPNEGDIVKLIEGFPLLRKLRLYDVRLSEADVIAIIKMLGSRLKRFGMSLDAQDVAPYVMLLTIMKSLTTYAKHISELDLRYHGLYCSYGPRSYDMLTWSVKKEMLYRLDHLHRQSPDLDLCEIEDLIMDWPCVADEEDDEGAQTKGDLLSKAVELRRCRRGMNEEGRVSHLMELAGLLETGCEGLEQDLDAAIELYKQAVRMGDAGDAIIKLWDLTENEDRNSSEVKSGGALELILEMDRAKTKTLPHFADLFCDGSRSHSARNHAAERVLQLAVDNGYFTPCAMRLAKLVEKGYGDVQPDPERAVELYRCLVNHCEDVDALFCLANWLIKGYANQLPNPAEARVYLELGVRKRCCRCMNLLGLLTFQGYEGVQGDFEAAIDLFHQAVDHGSQEAMISLGFLWCKGVPSNYCKAVESLEKAIAKDRNPIALRVLGLVVNTGDSDHPPNPKRSAALYEEANDLGDMLACTNLANLAGYGYEDYPPNPHKAISLFEKVAEEGNEEERAVALREYGYLVLHGSGSLEPDPKRAVECFRKAIDIGDVLALRVYRKGTDGSSSSSYCALARMFEMGYEDVPQDLEEAAELYKKGVDLGDPEAMFRLGMMLEEGFCTNDPDPLAAIELYNRAINEHNYGRAMGSLADLLERGYLEKPPDRAAAKAWFERRAVAGDQNGQSFAWLSALSLVTQK